MVNRLKKLLGLAALACITMSGAYASTYNFYFNNTEQGAGSTSTPTLSAGERAKETGSTQASEANSQLEKVVDKPKGTDATSLKESSRRLRSEAEEAGLAAGDKPSLHAGAGWRLGVGWTTINHSFQYYLPEFGDPDILNAHVSGGAVGSIGYFFNPYFGVNAFLGAVDTDLRTGTKIFGGLEGEVVPLRLSVFGAKDVIHLALLVGGTNAYKTMRDAASGLSFHTGARVTGELSSRFGATSTFRFTPFPGNDEVKGLVQSTFFVVEVGLVARI